MSDKNVWYISALIVLVCIFIAALVYLYTGQIFLFIFFAPPLVHYFLRKKNRNS